MAVVAAINAVCVGLEQYLTRAHQVSSIKDLSCTFKIVGTTEFKLIDGASSTCSLYLYRVTQNEHTRNLAGRAPKRPLAVDLHVLITVWADVALKEQTLLAWVMRELYEHPVLDRSLLAASGQFAATEQVQLIPEELTLDDMTKLWQVLAPPYRPSLTYVARNVVIGPDAAETYAPVVATRYEFTDEMAGA